MTYYTKNKIQSSVDQQIFRLYSNKNYIAIFRAMTPYNLAGVYKCIRGTFCLQLNDIR
jgi:hypothetical protein